MPATFLLSIAGLSVTLAGFSGLVSAFRRGAEWQALDAYRLRQIPEMGLATALLALLTFPLTESFGGPTAIRVTAAFALGFTLVHALVLLFRSRRAGLHLTPTNWWGALVVDVVILIAAVLAVVGGSTALLEWLLVLLLARPMLAFVLVVSGVTAA